MRCCGFQPDWNLTMNLTMNFNMKRRNFIALPAAAFVTAALAHAPKPAAMAPSGEVARFHARRKFATTRYGRIAYMEQGKGPAALFLHGFPLNSFQWRGALERLSPWRRCIAPDFLALGYTEVAEGQDVGPDAQVAMLIALLDQLGAATVDLVANDSGGAVAQLLLVRHPQRVRSLLLTNCDSEIDCPPAALGPVIEMAHAGTFADNWLGAWVRDKALARSAQGLGGLCYADPQHPDDATIDCYLAPLVASQRRKDLVHAYALALERNVLAGVAAGLRITRIPVRILWGAADTIFAAHGAAYLDRAFGNSKGVRMIEGSKLFWPEERPDIIAAEARTLWGLA
jgi:pimeloyl-ACP methyl ester carboxylesterase